MATIYISSTYSDLTAYREAVYHTLRQLRYEVIAMEDYVATDQRPLAKCLADVAACDLYVGIFGWRYGYIPQEENPNQRSITELEYCKAGEVGIPRLIFLLGEKVAWSPPFMDSMTGEGEQGQRIVALRNRLMTDNTISFFESPDDLANQASVSIQQELSRAYAAAQRFYRAANERFINHMRRLAGARTENDALRRYMALRLQSFQAQSNQLKVGATLTTLPAGPWGEIVHHPANMMVWGEAGGGKTTLLLYEARRMANEALSNVNLPLPLYLSLSAFTGGSADALLELAANYNEIPRHQVLNTWHGRERPLCLLLDGFDEACNSTALIHSLRDLCAANLPLYHSIVLTHRSEAVGDLLRAEGVILTEFALLPLNDEQITAFLGQYDAEALIADLDAYLREIVQTPALLSALGQSAHERLESGMPRNEGQIYELYMDQLFASEGGDYDYQIVKRPVLAKLAHQMWLTDQLSLPYGDDLLDQIASELTLFDQMHRRRRRIMPYDWTAEGLVEELCQGSVIEALGSRIKRIGFRNQRQRDYFAAVHLARVGIHSSEVQDCFKALDLQRSIGPLVMLLGIEPQAGHLLDALPHSNVALATQLWLENRPPGIDAPAMIRNVYELKLTAAQSCSYEVLWPLTHMPSDEAPMSLDAQTWAYALLHAGEWPPDGIAEWPFTLHIAWEERSFLFYGYGGGMMQIGPLTFFQSPTFLPAALHVVIDELDFDPALAACKFVFPHTPPAAFAITLFEAMRQVDWLELAVRCQIIALWSAEIIRKVEAQQHLAHLLPELRVRAASYGVFGERLAHDLGIAWRAVDTSIVPESVVANIVDAYQQLRRLYSRARQSFAIKLADESHKGDKPQSVDVQMNVQRLEGSAIGLQVGSALVREADPNEATRGPRRLTMQQNVDHITGGLLIGADVQSLQGSLAPSSTLTEFHGQLNVQHTNGGLICGMQIHQFDGGVYGWHASYQINIGNFTNSHLQGIILQGSEADFPYPDRPPPEAGKA